MNVLDFFAVEALDCKILINILFAFIAGILISLGYYIANRNRKISKNLVITILLLPPVVAVVIPLIATDLKKALSLAGIFALVRFRSVPGNSKDIFYIFFSLTVGVAIALNYYTVGFVLLLLISLTYILLERKLNLSNQQILKITIPEDMNFEGTFDSIFDKYLSKVELNNVHTSNMGSLFIVEYNVQLKNASDTKAMIDELRTKNGNLSIILQMDTYPNVEQL